MILFGVHRSCRPSCARCDARIEKSHHQGPFALATVTCDQRCHKGLPLRVPLVLPEEYSWGSFSRVPRMHCFPGFLFRGGIKGDIKGGH